MENRKKAIFLDLDGTLWESQKIPASAMYALQAARQNGHKVFVNTGRIEDNIPDFLWKMDLDGYSLATGMDIYMDGKQQMVRYLDPDLVRETVAHLNANYSGFSLQKTDCSFDDPKFAFRREVFLAKEGRPEFMNRKPLSRMAQEDWEQIVKVSFDTDIPFDLFTYAKAHDYDILVYKNKYNPLNGMGSFFRGELTDLHWTKGDAMHYIRDRLEGDYEIMALGDSENDLPMFAKADIAVCMGNGTESAKRAADYVSADLHNGGLAKAFAFYDVINKEQLKTALEKEGLA